MASQATNTNNGNNDNPTICYFKFDNGKYLSLAEGLEHDKSCLNIWSEYRTGAEVIRTGPKPKGKKIFKLNENRWNTRTRIGRYVDTKTDTEFEGVTDSQMGTLSISYEDITTGMKSGKYDVIMSGIKKELDKLKDSDPEEYTRSDAILNERSTFKMIPQKDGSFLPRPTRETWAELTGLCKGDVEYTKRSYIWNSLAKYRNPDLDLKGTVRER